MTNSSHDIMNEFDLYYNELKARSFENYEILSERHSKLLAVIKELFDIEQSVFKNFVWMIMGDFHKNSIAKKILCSAYTKNMYSLFSSIELILNGFYGSSRIIIRQVFEFIVIAKYSSVTHNEKFISHWEKGGNIGIGKQIFKKIKIKEIESLNAFWEELCQFNHATSSTQQIGVRYENIKDDILGDLAIVIILLNCNYHILTQHLIDSRMKYYGEYYFPDEKKNLNSKSKIITSLSRQYLTKHSLKIIRAFSSKWIIQE